MFVVDFDELVVLDVGWVGCFVIVVCEVVVEMLLCVVCDGCVFDYLFD